MINKTIPRKKINAIINRLGKAYPNASTALLYSTPIQFVISAILSAQCTDARVNIVTRKLFKTHKTIADFETLSEHNLRDIIRSCGLYQSKAKNIIHTIQKIRSDYNGQIPKTKKELLTLPGIGSKVANVILIELFKQPAFPVDTHVFRIARRLGLSTAKTPIGVEKDLTRIFDRSIWIPLHHQIIFHGRQTCTARNPKYDTCPLKEYCCKHCSTEPNLNKDEGSTGQ